MPVFSLLKAKVCLVTVMSAPHVMRDYTQGFCQYVFALGNERKCVLTKVLLHNNNISFCLVAMCF